MNNCHLLFVILLVLDKGSLIMYICHLPSVMLTVLDKGSYATHKLHNARDITSHMLHVTSLHMS